MTVPHTCAVSKHLMEPFEEGCISVSWRPGLVVCSNVRHARN